MRRSVTRISGSEGRVRSGEYSNLRLGLRHRPALNGGERLALVSSEADELDGWPTVAEIWQNLREAAMVVAASAEEQLAWCLEGSAVSVPVDEIPHHFEDMLFIWRARLEMDNLGKDPESTRCIGALISQFEMMRGTEDKRLWRDEGLQRPEWATARRLAIAIIDLPTPYSSSR
jgi:hypothetical protein